MSIDHIQCPVLRAFLSELSTHVTNLGPVYIDQLVSFASGAQHSPSLSASRAAMLEEWLIVYRMPWWLKFAETEDLFSGIDAPYSEARHVYLKRVDDARHEIRERYRSLFSGSPFETELIEEISDHVANMATRSTVAALARVSLDKSDATWAARNAIMVVCQALCLRRLDRMRPRFSYLLHALADELVQPTTQHELSMLGVLQKMIELKE